jgi:hypothetical protein
MCQTKEELLNFLNEIRKIGEMDAIVVDKRIIDDGKKLSREYMLFSPTLNRHLWMQEDNAENYLVHQISIYEWNSTAREFYSERKSAALQIYLMKQEAHKYYVEGQFDAKELIKLQRTSLYED